MSHCSDNRCNGDQQHWHRRSGDGGKGDSAKDRKGSSRSQNSSETEEQQAGRKVEDQKGRKVY